MAKVEGVPHGHPLEWICQTCNRQLAHRGAFLTHRRSCALRRDKLAAEAISLQSAMDARAFALTRDTGGPELAEARRHVQAVERRVLQAVLALYSAA